MRQPPRIAAWLLKCFGGNSRTREALLGDVQERYQYEQSKVWYWRQTLALVFAEMNRRISAKGRFEMKTAAVWSPVLLVVFGAGFLAGRVPSKPVKGAEVLLETDPEIAEYLNRVANNILKNSDNTVPVTFKVIQSEDANAVGLPGGFYYVNSGPIFDSNICSDRLASSMRPPGTFQRLNCELRKNHN